MGQEAEKCDFRFFCFSPFISLLVLVRRIMSIRMSSSLFHWPLPLRMFGGWRFGGLEVGLQGGAKASGSYAHFSGLDYEMS